MSNFSTTASALANSRAEAIAAWTFDPPSVEHDGKHITLPADPQKMNIPDAIRHLESVHKQNSMAVSPGEAIPCAPYDGLVAFTLAMKHLFGFVSAEMTPSFFGPQPPKTVSVRTGPYPEDAVVCLEGEFSIPALLPNHRIAVSRTVTDAFCGIVITGKTTRQYEHIVRLIAKTTMEFLREKSIYRGKAVRFDKPDLSEQPEFLDNTFLKKENIILNEEEASIIQTAIFTPIEHSATCRALNIPLKRGVILEGPYGVGKSLVAATTAGICAKNGWTFLTTNNADNLGRMIELAKLFEPCVVFIEDIDSAIGEDRDQDTNNILNILDGVTSKKSETMVVLTTNHIENIGRAMLRPGRLDTIVSLRPPRAEAAIRLLKLYGGRLLDKDVDFEKLGQELAGTIPASIREIVERSKLHTIPRMKAPYDTVLLKTEDILTTAYSMRAHNALLAKPEEKEATPLEDAVAVVGKAMLGSSEGLHTIMYEAIREYFNEYTSPGDLANDVDATRTTANDTLSNTEEILKKVS